MDNTRTQRERLITSTFRDVLNWDGIRILDRIEEEDIDYAIYLSQKNNLTDKELGEFIADFCLCKVVDKDKWFYMIAVHDIGGWDTPPSSDYVESKEFYDTFDDAFEALIIAIVKERIGDISESIYYEQ